MSDDVDFDPGIATSFSMVIDTIELKHLHKVTGLKSSNKIIKYEMVDAKKGKYIPKLINGRPESGSLTIERFWSNDESFQTWLDKVGLGQTSESRKNGEIVIRNPAGDRLRAFQFFNGIVKSIELSAVQAGSGEAMKETVCIDFESSAFTS